jgi:hypothetical protein
MGRRETRGKACRDEKGIKRERRVGYACEYAQNYVGTFRYLKGRSRGIR